MDALTARFFQPVREEELVLRGQPLRLAPPSAAQVLEAKAEAARMEPEADIRVLCSNACLLARALQTAEGPAFRDGEQVLAELTPAEIEELSRRLGKLCREGDPGVETPGLDAQAYKAALKADKAGRLRWRVLREFHALPGEERARKLRERDYLYCVLNLILDEEEKLDSLCPACRAKALEKRCACCGAPLTSSSIGENPAFDQARFDRLSKEGLG